MASGTARCILHPRQRGSEGKKKKKKKKKKKRKEERRRWPLEVEAIPA